MRIPGGARQRGQPGAIRPEVRDRGARPGGLPSVHDRPEARRSPPGGADPPAPGLRPGRRDRRVPLRGVQGPRLPARPPQLPAVPRDVDHRLDRGDLLHQERDQAEATVALPEGSRKIVEEPDDLVALDEDELSLVGEQLGQARSIGRDLLGDLGHGILPFAVGMSRHDTHHRPIACLVTHRRLPQSADPVGEAGRRTTGLDAGQ